MLNGLLHTQADWGGFILRLVLALVIFPHGAQKVLGWFGGYGYAGTMQFFTKHGGLPTPVALTVLAAEFVGPIALVAGFGGIISEVGAVMLVGGNIEGSTRVLTTAIVLETRQGHFDRALALGVVLLVISLLINLMVLALQGRNTYLKSR